jgi:hypothetical protein
MSHCSRHGWATAVPQGRPPRIPIHGKGMDDGRPGIRKIARIGRTLQPLQIARPVGKLSLLRTSTARAGNPAPAAIRIHPAPRPMPRRLPLLLLLAAVALSVPRLAAAQVVRVTVTDAATGAAIRDALVRLENADGALVRAVFTEREGVAAARVPAGAYTLRVGRAGYVLTAQPLRVVRGENAVAVQLSAAPFGMDTVVVIAPGENERGRDAFRRRSQTENGVFLGPDYFAQRYRGALWIGDLMTGAPGIITPMVPRTGRKVVVNARQWNCFNVLLNGEIYQGPGPIDNWVRPRDLVGVEIYHFSSSVPAEFRRYAWEDTDAMSALPCGVIIYWTRNRW